MEMLNIACGERYHKDWINVDFHADSKEVRKVNLLGGIPFENDSMDVVYCSHFLEHLPIEDGENIVKEIYRLLKKDGIARIVVPCLENICREYIRVLDCIEKDNNADYLKKHKFITIELLDQMTRDINGGNLQKIYERKDKGLADYILYRTGDNILQEVKYEKNKVTKDRIKNKLLYIYLKFVKILVSKNIRKLVFNNTSIGEKHKWMYDRYSLSELLIEAGFNNISIRNYNDSQIEGFNDYHLDSNNDGSPYKGVSSLYIEAIK